MAEPANQLSYPADPNAMGSAARLLEKSRRRQKKIERIVISFSLAFIIGIGIAAWVTDGEILRGTINALQSVEAKRYGNPQRWNRAANCQDAANKGTPYCMEQKARVEGDWRQIIRSGSDGGANAFSLHNH